MNDDRPRLAGYILPRISTVVWITIIGSVLGYFVWSRSAANLIAIIGAVAVTVVVFKTERPSG